jgi:aminodeoxyfutalosine deaminase
VRFIAADSVFNGQGLIPGDPVLVIGHQNLLKDIIPSSEIDPGKVERFKGTITPGFINAHCHLELSHLKDKIGRGTGLPRFGRAVITMRNDFHPEEIVEHMKDADRQMWNNGIVAVGDISNTNLSIPVKKESRIVYHNFIELIGLDPKYSDVVFNKGLELLSEFNANGLGASLAPHAPYSVSRELVKRISEFNSHRNLPLSMHNQESTEETLFMTGKKSAFHELYNFLNIDVSWFKGYDSTGLQNYMNELSPAKTILVHNTFSTAVDIKNTGEKKINWCFCPTANQYIENAIPDFNLFSNETDRICLGTDSLASNTALDVINEANIVLKNTATFKIENILQALTFNGAKALGLSEDYGQLFTGRNISLNLVGISNNELKFIKKIL